MERKRKPQAWLSSHGLPVGPAQLRRGARLVDTAVPGVQTHRDLVKSVRRSGHASRERLWRWCRNAGTPKTGGFAEGLSNQPLKWQPENNTTTQPHAVAVWKLEPFHLCSAIGASEA